MGKKILTFADIDIEKKNLTTIKVLLFRRFLVSDKICSAEKKL